MKYFFICLISIVLLFSSCGRHGGASDFPKDFSEMNDSQRMEFMMKNVDPDSVARFLYDAALGKIPGIKIDTLATAHLYALEHYRGDNWDIYSNEFENHRATLSLAESMRIEQMMGVIDHDALGYQLGLQFVGQIRERHLKEKEIEKEILELRKNADAETYQRFLIGFRLALKNDRGKDLSESIYNRFISFQ